MRCLPFATSMRWRPIRSDPGVRLRMKRGHICALVRNRDGTPRWRTRHPRGSPGWSRLSLRGRACPKQGLFERSRRHWRLRRPRTAQRTPREVVVTDASGSNLLIASSPLILDVSAALLLEAPQQTASVRRAANTDPVDLFVVEVGSGDNDRVIWSIYSRPKSEGDNARGIDLIETIELRELL